jgi:hypothetical protein
MAARSTTALLMDRCEDRIWITSRLLSKQETMYLAHMVSE